ncbi:MAG: energy-coupling factor transporter transmembrane protein EcfT [Selenomonadaceae bacterium]|nr:energy-coupling factor transporter transmembrane protein EcfT [Selenomonadaceae bacterium]MBR0102865.1 energy-coupling factor transporter transmembrane protein EcfT [Selenomonadaceae bacterium]
MLQDITLGQFFPGKSILHRLDPRTKIISLFALLIMIFAAEGWTAYLVLIVLTAGLIFLSKVPPLTVLKSVKPLSWIILFTLLIHFVSHDGEVLAKVYVFKVTTEGIIYGVKISLRLVLLIVLSSLLMFTTSPLQLTDATENLLSPLKRFGVPSHELAMMMTIAIRFVPTLIEETDKIIKAQKSRGLDFESGGFVKKLRAMVPILVPLFLSSFRRADDLAMAMEARCYRGGEGRTHMKQLRLTNLDYGAAAFVIAICAAIGGLSYAA